MNVAARTVSVAGQNGSSSPYVSRQMLRIDSADDRATDPGVAEQQLEASAHRVFTWLEAGVAAGKRLLDQNALAVGCSVVEHWSLGLLVGVVGDHRAIALLQRQQSAVHGLAGEAVAENLKSGRTSCRGRGWQYV